MRTKHPVEALEFTMRWKDGHPSPGRLNIHNSIKTVVSRHWHSGVNWVHSKRLKVSLYVILYRPSRGSATIHDWAGFTRVFLRNAANGMSALRLRSSTRNAAKSELIEEKLVHLRCKFIARGTRIVVISMAVNTQGVRFQKKLKTILQTIEKGGTVRVVYEFIFPSVEIQGTILKRREVNKSSARAWQDWGFGQPLGLKFVIGWLRGSWFPTIRKRSAWTLRPCWSKGNGSIKILST